MLRVGKRRGVKILIDGPDAEGKNTSRSVTLADATVDEVLAVIVRAIDVQAIEDARRTLAAGEQAGGAKL